MDAASIMTELRHALLAEPRVAAAIVFGSAARDALRADSDVDIAYLPTDDEASRSLENDFLDVLGALGTVAGRDVHLVELARAEPALRRSVFERGRVPFDRSAGCLRKLEADTLIQCFDDEYLRRVIDAGQRRRLESSLGRR